MLIPGTGRTAPFILIEDVNLIASTAMVKPIFTEYLILDHKFELKMIFHVSSETAVVADADTDGRGLAEFKFIVTRPIRPLPNRRRKKIAIKPFLT